MNLPEHKCDKMPGERTEFELDITYCDGKWELDIYCYDSYISLEVNYCPFCGEKLEIPNDSER